MPVATVPQVQFSEPVRNIPEHVKLLRFGSNGWEDVPARLIGIKPGTLEILHGIRLAVGRAHLGELLGQRIAEDRQPAPAQPVAPEDAAQRMPRRREEFAGA